MADSGRGQSGPWPPLCLGREWGRASPALGPMGLELTLSIPSFYTTMLPIGLTRQKILQTSINEFLQLAAIANSRSVQQRFAKFFRCCNMSTRESLEPIAVPTYTTVEWHRSVSHSQSITSCQSILSTADLPSITPHSPVHHTIQHMACYFYFTGPNHCTVIFKFNLIKSSARVTLRTLVINSCYGTLEIVSAIRIKV